MRLIVDSGSTKSNWVLIDENGSRKAFDSMGLNPYFHSEKEMVRELRNMPGLYELRAKVTHVNFYGAGCSSESLNQIFERALSGVFHNAKIKVDHDLTACAYACYEGEPVIACILGTGSNSCYFDGIKVTENIPALGYILGDEGSGSYFGKQILANFLYERLPEHLMVDFSATYGLNKDLIVDHVYMQPNANVYIASFMRFVVKHAADPYMKDMVREGFIKFLDVHVKCYKQAATVKASFIGSAAHFFETELREAGKIVGVNIGIVVQKPIDRLVAYHLNAVNELSK